MSVEQLRAALDAADVAADPDSWALAAYRLAVADAETATRPDDLDRDVELLGRAGRILTAERAPIEHARILTALGSCRRLQGAPRAAADLFAEAIGLQRNRAEPRELAASLVNLGLALTEAGSPGDAVVTLDEALDAWPTAVPDEEAGRLRSAALINRAQALQLLGGADRLRRAASDYRAAAAAAAPTSPQRGIALHGLGTLLLELDGDAAGAIEQFVSCLRILTVDSFPFQHAIARHSLAVAHERLGTRTDLARGLDHVEAAMSTFDPRLHATSWRTAADTLDRLTAALGTGTSPAERAAVFAELVGTASEPERSRMIRDRLDRIARQPDVRRSRDLDVLMRSLAEDENAYEQCVRSVVSALMDLPDATLDDACAALARANRAHPDGAVRDRIVDDVIHDLLFGPQRVRVRDLLESHGWVRP